MLGQLGGTDRAPLLDRASPRHDLRQLAKYRCLCAELRAQPAVPCCHRQQSEFGGNEGWEQRNQKRRGIVAKDCPPAISLQR